MWAGLLACLPPLPTVDQRPENGGGQQLTFLDGPPDQGRAPSSEPMGGTGTWTRASSHLPPALSLLEGPNKECQALRGSCSLGLSLAVLPSSCVA